MVIGRSMRDVRVRVSMQVRYRTKQVVGMINRSRVTQVLRHSTRGNTRTVKEKTLAIFLIRGG